MINEKFYRYFYDGIDLRHSYNSKRRELRGEIVGCISKDHGYRTTTIDKKRFMVHRIIWEMNKGPIPGGMQVDHINHIRTDNRLSNFRLVTAKDNRRNMTISSRNTSGCHGVRLVKKTGKYEVYANIDRKYKFICMCDTLEEAASARKEWDAMNGYHDNHGLAGKHYLRK